MTSPPAEKTSPGFRPDIQGLRALAVTMVVLYHLNPALLPGGFAGVDVFFVISGFLITGHLLREYRRTGRIALAGFWGRRAKRLMPAAALVLAATWLGSLAVLPASRLAETAAQIRASALYFQNWQLAGNAVDYLKADSAATPVQHFWSLSVEEQFYLGWPLLFLVAGLVGWGVRSARRRNPPVGDRERDHGTGLLLVLAAVVAAASLAYSAYETRVDPAAAYFVTTTRIWELALGGVIALLPERVTRRLGRFGLAGWAGLGLMIASAFVLSGASAFPGTLALLPAGGAAAAILCGSAAGRYGPHRVTSVRPALFLGGISYSLYLWHWPLIVLFTSWRGQPVNWVSGPVIAVVAVLLAWGTKVWVEDRVRGLSLLAGHDWRSLSTVLAAAVPLVLVGVFIAGEPGPWSGPLPAGYPGAAARAADGPGTRDAVAPKPVLPPPNAIALPEYWRQGCLVAENSATPKTCAFGDTTHPVLTVALVGDSIAGNWFTPLEQIARQRHWKLITDLHAECPLTTAMMIAPDAAGPYTVCHDWGTAVVHDLERSIRPSVVITSDLPGLATVGHPGGGPLAQQEIGDGMARDWELLEGWGIPVVAIRETPEMGINIPSCVENNPASQSVCTIPAARAIKPDVPSTYATAVAGGTVPLIDMNPVLCDETSCPPVIGNVLVYQDNHHLTGTFAATVAPYLNQQLQRASKEFDTGKPKPRPAPGQGSVNRS